MAEKKGLRSICITKMKCNYCGFVGEYSLQRLGRKCGHCKKGKYIPIKEVK